MRAMPEWWLVLNIISANDVQKIQGKPNRMGESIQVEKLMKPEPRGCFLWPALMKLSTKRRMCKGW